MAGVWSSSETMPEQKIELQNVKKYVSTFELNIPLMHNVTDIV